MDPSSPDSEALLLHLAWVRNLASRLVDDPHVAEDVVQDTVLAALTHAPKTDRPLKGWLAAVARNFARERKRTASRRHRRERTAARPEGLPATLDVVAQAAVQREVVGRVLELPEPYRTTILLRFFEDLPPRKIAARMGVPVSTVKTRITRGLDRIRARLDQTHEGDRRAWMVMLLPIAARSRTAPLTAASRALRSTPRWAWIAATVALVGVGVTLGVAAWPHREPRAPASTEVARATEPPSAAPADAAVESPRRESTPEVASTAPKREAAPPAAPEPVAAGRLHGKVLSARGQPLAGMVVRYTPFSRQMIQSTRVAAPLLLDRPDGAAEAAARNVTATSAADGSFEMDPPDWPGDLVIATPGFATVLAGVCQPRASRVPPIVVAAPVRAIAGTVVTESRAPVAGAVVRVTLPADFRATFGEILDATRDNLGRATTGPAGRFAMPMAPAVEAATLHVECDGFEPRDLPISSVPSGDAEILLRKKSPASAIAGRVVDADGDAVAHATVVMGDEATTTDERGEFVLDASRAPTPARIVAAARGSLPGEAEWSAVARASGTPVVITLGGVAASVVGRVVNADGSPATDALVWVVDPTPFGRVAGVPIFTECVVSGARDSVYTNTDARGRFRIHDLLARDYRVRAIDVNTLVHSTTETATFDGEEVTLVLAGDDTLQDVLSGRVVDPLGHPMEGLAVSLATDFLAVAGGQNYNYHLAREAAISDAQGRFALRRVPKTGVVVRVDGDDIVPREIDVADARATSPLEIAVKRRCHFRVELADPAAAPCHVVVLDADDSPLRLYDFFGTGDDVLPSAPIVAGRTGVLAVEEGARTLVLRRDADDVDLRRVPLVVSPGPVTVVRL